MKKKKVRQLDELTEMVKKFREARHWENTDPKDAALSLVLEAAEVLEHFQWLKGRDVLVEDRLKVAIGEELSDVMWWVLVLADVCELDMGEAFVRKVGINNKKYPKEAFAGKGRKDRRKAYYKLKAKHRGGHPLVEEDE